MVVFENMKVQMLLVQFNKVVQVPVITHWRLRSQATESQLCNCARVTH